MSESLEEVIVSPVEPNIGERRRHPRYAFTAAVEAVESKSRTRIQGRTADLAEGGCYVDTISPFPAETIIKLRIVNENRLIETSARVVYSLPGMGMGVMFATSAPEQIKIVEQWIGELSGEVQPEADESAPAQEFRGQEVSNDKSYYVLHELVIELMRQGVLSDARGKEMMKRLLS